jgi:hypothetical protein
MRRVLGLIGTMGLVAGLIWGAPALAAKPSSTAKTTRRAKVETPDSHWCNTNGITCAEPLQNWNGFKKMYAYAQAHGVELQPYIGHDEPSVLFYSNQAGSGNSNTYQLQLPTQAPDKPRQDESGGTWDFQLHPAFWFGMDICDDQSAPNPAWSGAAYQNVPCTPDSDANIFTSTDPSSPKYIGKHPGTAFMEMQFYPPGWAPWPPGTSCDASKWCAALNIDSLSLDMNTGVGNNADCQATAGEEYVNFDWITTTGTAAAPAGPLHPEHFVPDPNAFLMGNGDQITLQMNDTSGGFQVVLTDHTTGTTGSMTASVANGFASLKFDPNASTCTELPQAFHPAYATSSPSTFVSWTAHTYNVAYSDEIGHFEFCHAVNPHSAYQVCGQPGGADSREKDGDDYYCQPADTSTNILVTGCLGTDGDFDGESYLRNWPGSLADPQVDKLLHPSPIMFTSPTFNGQGYDQAAFETDLPRIEESDINFGHTPCQAHIQNPADPNPGQGCVNPPPGSRFYPFFSTTSVDGQCWWQEGGSHLPNTTNSFGGEIREFGSLLANSYPTSPPGTVEVVYENFHQTLATDPCGS